MKKMILAVICAAMLFGTIAIVYAEREEWRGEIRTRIHEAKAKIDRGIERGTLTGNEARSLQEELDRILDKIDRMKDDGHLSPMEREKIDHDLDRLERDITREKRDDETRRKEWRAELRTRIHEAKENIERGIERGTLTRNEARSLREELDRILDKIDRMKDDGHLSPMEREKIDHDLDRLERDVAREKRDDETRPGDDDHPHH